MLTQSPLSQATTKNLLDAAAKASAVQSINHAKLVHTVNALVASITTEVLKTLMTMKELPELVEMSRLVIQRRELELKEAAARAGSEPD